MDPEHNGSSIFPDLRVPLESSTWKASWPTVLHCFTDPLTGSQICYTKGTFEPPFMMLYVDCQLLNTFVNHTSARYSQLYSLRRPCNGS